MSRVTIKQLEKLVLAINKAANTPLTYMSESDGKRIINIGHYHLDQAYGGIKLVQTDNDGGGIRCVTHSGYTTKSKLYNEMYAFLCGLKARAN